MRVPFRPLPQLLLLATAASPVAALGGFLSGIVGNLIGLFLPIAPELACGLRFALLGFELGSFERYTEYFRADSRMVLAESGAYVGPDSITEYVQFVFGEFSPYLIPDEGGFNEVMFRGYDSDTRVCTFLLLRVADVIVNPENARTGLNGQSLNEVDMLKIEYNFFENFIPSINIFFATGFLNLFFGYFLNSVPTRDFVCGVYQGACGDVIVDQPADCTAALAALPITTGDGAVDGDSQGCRALHGAFARNNLFHCPHISIAPQMDGNGNEVCQTSSNLQPEDLFTEEELAIWTAFAIANGFDPAIGHDYNLTGVTISNDALF